MDDLSDQSHQRSQHSPGWVLASRIARVRLDGSADREAISLDVPGLAIADPHGLAITENEKRLVVTASGTHELLVYRLQDLPFEGAGVQAI